MPKFIRKSTNQQAVALEVATDQEDLVENINYPETPIPEEHDDPDAMEIDAAMDRIVARQQEDTAENEPEFSPLDCALPHSTPFPLTALGENLTRFALALSEMTGTPIAMNAVAVLAFVNLAVSALADIAFIGTAIPISLYFLIVGSSGERKSSIFRRLSQPVLSFEKRLAADLERIRAERDRKSDGNGESGEKSFGTRLLPKLLFTEATTAALYYVLMFCTGRMCLFVPEIGVFLNGHGMAKDQKLSTMSQLSTLFDAEPVTIIRRGDGVISVVAKRLTVLLLGPWKVVRSFLADPLARGQGLMSRILVCFPDTLIGSRPLNMTPEAAIAIMNEYDEWMTDTLNLPLPLAEGTDNELKPPALVLTEGAIKTFSKFYNSVEKQMGEFGPDSEKLDLVNKIPTISLKIGATLQMADNPASTQLDETHVSRGIDLAHYFMNEILRLNVPPPLSESLEATKLLLNALRERELTEFSRTWCYSQGPHSLRTKQALMVRVPAGFDETTLARVVRVLEGL